MKPEQTKQKMHKDLSFLTKENRQVINQKLWKYHLQQLKQYQNEKLIKDIVNPCSIYFDYKKYDYRGKFITKVHHQSLNHPPTKNQIPTQQKDIYEALTHMKQGQKAWFNIMHKQKGSKDCAGFHGYHYELFVESVKYKNEEKIQSKRLMFNMNKNDGKKLFARKEYVEASKIYENSINIFSNPSKKLYSKQEIEEINSYKHKSEINYLRCVCKMKRYDEKVAEKANLISKQVLERDQKLALAHYLRAGYFRFVSHFGYAFEQLQKALQLSKDSGEKQSLKAYVQIVKESKQKNIRHMKRQEIRKKKTTDALNQSWGSNSQKDQMEQQTKMEQQPKMLQKKIVQQTKMELQAKMEQQKKVVIQ